jgi:hypothetical protein
VFLVRRIVMGGLISVVFFLVSGFDVVELYSMGSWVSVSIDSKVDLEF